MNDQRLYILSNLGLVYEIYLYKTFIYEHRICRINPILNKKYKWQSSNITFLENNTMDAFGFGEYKFVDKYLVKCYFGGREHLLEFNNDYSRFTSVRKDDFEVIEGNYL